jgi:type I restriction enzyme S subunit
MRFDDLKHMLIPCPPKNEQEEIINYIISQKLRNFNLINSLKKLINRLSEYRSALISSAVTGKIDVRNWQDKEVTALE